MKLSFAQNAIGYRFILSISNERMFVNVHFTIEYTQHST